MKQKFTMLQKILTTLFVVLVGAVITADVLKLFVFENQGNTYYNVVNLVLCLLLLAIFLALIFNPKAGTNAENEDTPETLAPQLSASRTYMCFIAVDIALIFTFVMYFSKYFEKPAVVVIAGGVLIFVIGAIKYISDCKKIGFEEIEYEEDDEQEEKPQEVAEVTAEVKLEKPAEPAIEEPKKLNNQTEKPVKDTKAEEAEPEEMAEEAHETEVAAADDTAVEEVNTEENSESMTEKDGDEKAEKAEPQQEYAPKNNSHPLKNYPAKKNSGKGKKKKKK